MHLSSVFFQDRDFVLVHTPALTGNDCEGAGETFLVQPPADTGVAKEKEEEAEGGYFSKPAFLTVSGQLHLEAVCNGMAKVRGVVKEPKVLLRKFRATNAYRKRCRI